MSDAYGNARRSGMSDGSAAGHLGAHDHAVSQRHLERQRQLFPGQPRTGTRDEGRMLGEGLMAIIGALFLHKHLCFVGFWLIGFALLAALPVYVDIAENALAGIADWYLYVAVSLPVVLAVVFRRFIPTLMKWIYFGLLTAVLATVVIGVIVAIVRRGA
jgi:hypothetical protein